MKDLEIWYENLSEIEKIDVANAVAYYGKWPKGMGSVFYYSLTIYKRQFDWVKRNVTW